MTTIAEQVTQLKKDFDEVAQEQFRVGYNEGNMKGWDDGYDSAEGEYKPQIETSYQQGVTVGKEAERNEFWQNQHYINCYSPTQNVISVGPYAFFGWNMLNFKPTQDLKLASVNGMLYSATNAFAYTGIAEYTPGQMAVHYASYDLVKLLEEHGVSLTISETTKNLSNLFYSSTVSRVPAIDLSNVTNVAQMFAACTELVTIECLTVSASTPTLNCFNGCTKLENITITGTLEKGGTFNYCSRLSHASLMSIINALKTYTDGGTYKIQLGSTNIAKLTDEELAQIEAKGWTYV